jgi:hypothetical protein
MDDNNSISVNRSGIFKKFMGFILYALNPVKTLKEEKKLRWYYHLIIPAVGWMLFFLQVGIYNGSQFSYPFGKILLLSLTGLALGYFCVLAISCLLVPLLAIWKIRIRTDQAVSCVALSHTYMVLSAVIGLVYSIFGSISPSSFGITGLLCTMLPIYSAIRSLGNKKAFAAPVLASVVGVLMLAGWQLILIINA